MVAGNRSRMVSKRATDVMIAGKVVVVLGYGDVGKRLRKVNAGLMVHGCWLPKSTRSVHCRLPWKDLKLPPWRSRKGREYFCDGHGKP